MDLPELLLEVYGRVPPLIGEAVDGLAVDDLLWAPSAGANPIAWLAWHVARVEDHQLSELFDTEQLWVTGAWAAGFQLEPDPNNMGYGHDAADIARVRPQNTAAITDYLAAAHERTASFLGGLDASALDRIVDRRWDPPVTMGVRLVSVADDCLQHAGQAAYVRGLLERR